MTSQYPAVVAGGAGYSAEHFVTEGSGAGDTGNSGVGLVYVLCYVGQYMLYGLNLLYILFVCLGVIILCLIVCTAIHNCLSSGSLFFASLRQNN